MKIVCYTSLVGDYDKLRKPKYTSENWDYVCFTDQTLDGQGVWTVNPLHTQIDADPGRTNRWHKMHPHKLFPDYDISIYIDANIRITGPHLEKRAKDFIASKTLIALPPHPKRNCVYQEIQRNLIAETDKPEKIQQVESILRQANFPENAGLFENNIIVRQHHHRSIIQLNEEWWHFVSRYAKRDQLSFTYLLKKHDLVAERIVPKGSSIRNFKGYKRYDHKMKFAALATYQFCNLIPIKNWRRQIRRSFLKKLRHQKEVA